MPIVTCSWNITRSRSNALSNIANSLPRALRSNTGTLEKEEMEEELDTVKDQLLDAEIKLEQMKQELEDSSSVEVTSSGGDDDHAALIEQNKKLRTALST